LTDVSTSSATQPTPVLDLERLGPPGSAASGPKMGSCADGAPGTGPRILWE